MRIYENNNTEIGLTNNRLTSNMPIVEDEAYRERLSDLSFNLYRRGHVTWSYEIERNSKKAKVHVSKLQ